MNELLLAQRHAAEQPPPPSLAKSMDLTTQTERVLASLTPRETEVLRMRIGDPAMGEINLDDSAMKERVKAIAARALEKLRNPPNPRDPVTFGLEPDDE